MSLFLIQLKGVAGYPILYAVAGSMGETRGYLVNPDHCKVKKSFKITMSMLFVPWYAAEVVYLYY